MILGEKRPIPLALSDTVSLFDCAAAVRGSHLNEFSQPSTADGSDGDFDGVLFGNNSSSVNTGTGAGGNFLGIFFAGASLSRSLRLANNIAWVCFALSAASMERAILSYLNPRWVASVRNAISGCARTAASSVGYVLEESLESESSLSISSVPHLS